jgi:hypothetical protein
MHVGLRPHARFDSRFETERSPSLLKRHRGAGVAISLFDILGVASGYEAPVAVLDARFA